MFAVGDMHASMGDGEICFTGVEMAGAVTVRFDVLKGKQATWPAPHFGTIARFSIPKIDATPAPFSA
jgi:acetamidase/formamidase